MLVRTLLVAATATALLPAQNWFQVYPERNGTSVTYVTRPGGFGQVEVLTELPGDVIAGVGDNSAACEAVGYRVYTVDENPSTVEQFDVVVRQADSTGQPAFPELSRAGPFATPPSTVTARTTVVLTVTFATPLPLPCQGTWFHGVDLYAATPGPTSDGLAIWSSYYYPPTTGSMPRPFGDNPRLGAPNLAWNVIGSSVSRVGQPTTYRMGPLVATPVLAAGGIDPANTFQSPLGSPNYGAGGLFPDVSGAPRADGIGVLVEDASRTGGLAWVLLGLQMTPMGLPLFGFGGRLYVDPSLLIAFGSQPIGATGAEFTLLAPGSITSSAIGARVHYQAVVVGGPAGTAALSNATGAMF